MLGTTLGRSSKHGRSRSADQSAWRSALQDPTSQTAAHYLSNKDSLGSLDNVIAAKGLAGSEKADLIHRLYVALCNNRHIGDQLAMGGLKTIQRHHKPASMSPLDPARAATDSCPAILALSRPLWLKQLLDGGLRANTRFKPTSRPMRGMESSTLLHVAAYRASHAVEAHLRQAAAQACSMLLQAGAGPCALDSCGMVALEWHLMDISSPAASTTTSPFPSPYLNPYLITTLWTSLATTLPTAALLPPAKALPLLQMPRQQLVTGLQRLVQQGLDEQPPTGELTVALQLVAASWDEVLPLLGLAQRWGHFFTLQGMAERVIATRRIAAGQPGLKAIEHVTPEMAPGDPGNMAPAQLASFLAHLRAHPSHLGLYAILERVGHDRREVVGDAALAQVLPQGLKAALQLAQPGQAAGCQAHPRPSPAQLLPILGTVSRVLRPAADTAWEGAGFGAVEAGLRSQFDRWEGLGVAADLRAAAALGCGAAAHCLCIMVSVTSSEELARSYVDMLLETRGLAEGVAGNLQEVADSFSKGRLPMAEMGTAMGKLVCLATAGRCHGLAQLMAGPVGRQARRLSAFEGDERLMARVGPEMGDFCSYVAGNAREVLELAEAAGSGGSGGGETGTSRAAGGSAAGAGGGGTRGAMGTGRQEAAASIEAAGGGSSDSDRACGAGGVDMVRATEGVLVNLKRGVNRQQAKLYGRACDECGVLGAELAERGLKLQQCSRCKAAWYCGPRCQKAAWKARHKHECGAA